MLRLAVLYQQLLLKAATVASPADSSADLRAVPQVDRPRPMDERPVWNVVYGGSFNPFHVGHEDIARRLCEVRGVRRVFVIPAGRSPGRQPAMDGVDALMPWKMRYDMAQLSLKPLAATVAAACELTVSDIERPAPDGRPNFTWETMQQLMASKEPVHPGAQAGGELWAMVLGADQAHHFHKWKDASAILGAGVAIWVVPRAVNASTTSTDARRDAEMAWAQILSAVLQSDNDSPDQTSAIRLVWEGHTARGFVNKARVDEGWETLRWLGWHNVGSAALRTGSGSCEEMPALSSSAIRRGELGIEAVAPSARPIWARWRQLREMRPGSRAGSLGEPGSGIESEPEPEPEAH